MSKKPQGKIRYLSPSDIIGFLTCPTCFVVPKSSLIYKKSYFLCKKCKQKYPLRNKIIQLIDPKKMTAQVKSEMLGNDIKLTKKNIEHYSKKDSWSPYYSHVVDQKMNYLLGDMGKFKFDGIISLGSGPGFELKEILKRRKFSKVLSSDLAMSATQIVPYSLNKYPINLGLFTSDLNYPPVIPNTNYPIIIYEALHHTTDSVQTIGKLLKRGYYNIFFVEPCTNFLIKLLAKIGLAQRVEYSGVKPDFVDLNKVNKLAKKYKYKLTIHTIWDVPEEYIRQIAKKGSTAEKIIVAITDIISALGNIVNFGSFAVVHLRKE